MILLAFILSVLYWIVLAAVSSIVNAEGTFLKELLQPDSTEIWMRLPAIMFLAAACIYSKIVIARRRKIEKELIQKYDLVPAVLNKLNSPVMVFDSLGKILRFNLAAEKLSGYSFDEVRDKFFWKIFLDERETEIIKNYLTGLDKGKFPESYEVHWHTKDHRRRLIKWSNTLISDKKNRTHHVISFGIDITAHQYTEDVLKRSEKEYRNIVDNIGIGVALISSDIKILYANHQMHRWFSNADTLKLSVSHSMLGNSSRARCLSCTTCKTLADGNVHEATLKTKLNDKEYIFKVMSFPVKNNEGRVIAAIETFEDFTKLDRQEEEIRHSYLTQAVINSLLRFSLENISFEGFLKCALTVILSSPSFTLAQTGAIYFVDDDPQTLVLKAQSRLPENIQKKYEKVPFGKHVCGMAAQSGAMHFVEATDDKQSLKEDTSKSYGHYCVPILYAGNILGVIDVYLQPGHKRNKNEEDFLHSAANALAGVVQRKKAERKISQVNDCFINLGVEAHENIQQLVDLCGNILGATSAFYKRLDKEEGKFHTLAKYNAHAHYVNAKKAEGSLCLDAINKAKGQAYIVYELPKTSYARTDPSVANYKINTYMGQAVKCRGEFVGVICATYDKDCVLGAEDKKFLSIIASAIGREEERFMASQELKNTCDKLEEAQYGLVQSEKLAALGRFSSGIAHEVKNPLGIILGGIEFLEKKLQSEDKVVVTAMKKIKDSTLRADSIVRNLLKFAMPSEIKKERVRPQELVNETLSLLKYRVPLINIRVKTEFPKEDVFVEVDRNQLGQVLFNLFINAIEAMPKGGPLRIKAYKTVLKDKFKGNPVCVIEVIDRGEGISKENLSKLFEPFFTTKRDKKGTGLGLAMSRIIVANHRGTLTLESELKKGTIAKVILPAV